MKVHIISFEFAPVVKVGGLAEVPANQVKHLSSEFDISVFLPSHGKLEKLSRTYECQQLPIKYSDSVTLVGDNYTQNVQILIGFYKCAINGTSVVLLNGENELTRKYLNDEIVYNPDSFHQKLQLFSLGLKYYFNEIIKNEIKSLPQVIHIHDYHAVIPYIAIKQSLDEIGHKYKSIITIHLLTWPRLNFQFYKSCGISESPLNILFKEGYKKLNFSDFYNLIQQDSRFNNGELPPSVEQIGAVISDLVTTVSSSYLKSDIIPNLGKDLIEFKSDFVWDGCDWDYNETLSKVLRNLGDEMRNILNLDSGADISKTLMKQYLLTYKIGNLNQSPLINSEKVLKIINEISNGNPFVKNGNIRAFNASGPLILTTGRISPQKGFETIFDAVPKVVEAIPDAKFLFLILPTDYSLNEIKSYSQFVKKYPNNVRIIFGVAAEIFYLAHIAADVYCALSRWEPFGIMVLEAMASRLPVVVTRVGGLQETVIDIRENRDNGTGIIIEKDNAQQLASALISLLFAYRLSNIKQTDDSTSKNLISKIPDEKIQKLVTDTQTYYETIRINAEKRVKNFFSWKNVSQKLLELYKRLSNF